MANWNDPSGYKRWFSNFGTGLNNLSTVPTGDRFLGSSARSVQSVWTIWCGRHLRNASRIELSIGSAINFKLHSGGAGELMTESLIVKFIWCEKPYHWFLCDFRIICHYYSNETVKLSPFTSQYSNHSLWARTICQHKYHHLTPHKPQWIGFPPAKTCGRKL